MFSNLSSVYAVFEVKTVTSLHFIDGQRVDTNELPPAHVVHSIKWNSVVTITNGPKIFFYKKMSAVYSRLLHCRLIHPVCPSTTPPPQHQILHKHCLHSLLGGGADYCNVPPVIAGRNWKQCCFGEGLGEVAQKVYYRAMRKWRISVFVVT